MNLELATRLQRTKPPRVDEAAGFVRAALIGHPDHPALHKRPGELLLAAGQPGLAVAPFTRVRDARPDNADAEYDLGRAYDAGGRFEKATTSYRQATRLDPNRHFAHFHLAWACRHLGRDSDAAAAFREAVRANPKYFYAWCDLAWLLATTADARVRDTAAAMAAATAEQLKPTDVRTARALGAARYSSGDWAGAKPRRPQTGTRTFGSSWPRCPGTGGIGPGAWNGSIGPSAGPRTGGSGSPGTRSRAKKHPGSGPRRPRRSASPIHRRDGHRKSRRRAAARAGRPAKVRNWKWGKRRGEPPSLT